MKKSILAIFISAYFSLVGIAQEANFWKKGWGVTAEYGINSNRHNSAFASLSPNYSIGVLKIISNNEKYENFIQLQFNVLNERLKNVPSSFINSDGAFASELIKQKTMYPLLFLGWRLNKKLNKQLFLNVGLGFNYKFSSIFYSTNSQGTEKVNLPKSGKNFFFSNPELAIGIGYIVKVDEVVINLIPRYRLNIGTKSSAGGTGISNSLYMVNSLGIETNIIF